MTQLVVTTAQPGFGAKKTQLHEGSEGVTFDSEASTNFTLLEAYAVPAWVDQASFAESL
jgi:hypothetical protein